MTRLLNNEQAAELLNVSIYELKRLRNSRALAVVRVSRKTPRYRVEDVEAFIERRRVAAVWEAQPTTTTQAKRSAAGRN